MTDLYAPPELDLPSKKWLGFLEPHRYKGAHGGRGGAKSRTIGNILVNMAARKPMLIACGREFQNSIEDSVYRVLENAIKDYGLPYKFYKTSIENTQTGSEFIFKGLSKLNASSIRSLEGADILYLEEAQSISEASYESAIPTIRKEGSEIWAAWNDTTVDAPTHKRFILNPHPDSYVIHVGWQDNYWFPSVLNDERKHHQLTNPKTYANVWEGEPETFAEGAFFRDEMAALDTAGRIGDVPHNPNKPVWVFWDMSHSASGKSDPNAVVFVQEATPGTYNVIDYWEGNNYALPTVVKDIVVGRKDKAGVPYTYAKMVLPHDAENVNSHSGMTDGQIMEGFGLVVDNRERTRDARQDTINVRTVLPLVSFDRERCATLVSALKGHRQVQDEKTKLWKFVHDWTSHGVDAFRYFCVYHNEGNFRTINTNWRRSGRSRF